MVTKRGWILSVFLFVILIGFASAYTCDLRLASSCNAAPFNNILMKISALNNAHGEVYTQSNYQYALCCDFTYTKPVSCSTDSADAGTLRDNRVLGLSSTTNAHAEVPNPSAVTYTTGVCYQNMECIHTSNACPGDYPIEMLSLSSATNAHIASYDTMGYDINVCCKDVTNPAQSNCQDNICQPGDICQPDPPGFIPALDTPYCCAGTCCTSNFGPEVCLNKVCGIYTNTCGQTYDCSGGLPDPYSKSCTINYGTCSAVGTQSCNTATGQWNTQCTGTTNPIPTNCAGKQCGSDGCGGICGTCAAGNSCDVNGQCISGTSLCTVTSAGWDRTNAAQGDTVSLEVVGTSDCAGESVSFTVWEEDTSAADQHVTTEPVTTSFVYNGSHYKATGQWTAEWQADSIAPETEPPEYYFRTNLISNGKVNESGQGNGIRLMTVAGSSQCTANFCSDYTNENDCNTNPCGNDLISAEALMRNGELCGGSCPNSNNQYYNSCACYWDTTSNSCEFTSTLLTCPAASCGDGVIDTSLGETCDGAALPFTTCSGNVDACTDGTVSCYPPGHAQQCTLDTTLCIGCTAGGFCGDEIIQQPNSNGVREDCDGSNLNGKTCLDFGSTIAIGLSCYGNTTSKNCTFDTSGCIEDPFRNEGTGSGTCSTVTTALQNCEEGNGIYTATFGGRWNWTTTFNTRDECVQANYPDCYQDVLGDGKWHNDATSGGTKANCETSRTKSMECPAEIALPFFTPLNVLITLLTIASIYGLLALEKRKR